MSKKTFRIIMSVLLIAIGAMIYLNIEQDRRVDWDVCYKFTNQKIEWTGAGYSGINRR